MLEQNPEFQLTFRANCGDVLGVCLFGHFKWGDAGVRQQNTARQSQSLEVGGSRSILPSFLKVLAQLTMPAERITSLIAITKNLTSSKLQKGRLAFCVWPRRTARQADQTWREEQETQLSESISSCGAGSRVEPRTSSLPSPKTPILLRDLTTQGFHKLPEQSQAPNVQTHEPVRDVTIKSKGAAFQSKVSWCILISRQRRKIKSHKQKETVSLQMTQNEV